MEKYQSKREQCAIPEEAGARRPDRMTLRKYYRDETRKKKAAVSSRSRSRSRGHSSMEEQLGSHVADILLG